MDIIRVLPKNQFDAATNANTPSASNPFATALDLSQLSVSGGGDKTFNHNQGTASSVWTINHNLGKNPSVTVIDNGNSVVEGEILYIDINTISITFSSAFAGDAYLN